MAIDVTSIATSTITIGTGGSGGVGAAAGSNGSAASTWVDGTNTLTANPANGGNRLGDSSGHGFALGGAGGSASGGDLNLTGSVGWPAHRDGVSTLSGSGAASMIGASKKGVDTDSAGGGNALNYGSGGSGASSVNGGGAGTGGDGSDGYCIVTEFY